MIEKNWLNYWVDPETWKFIGDFEGMYKDFEDPWNCQARNKTIARKVVLSVLSELSHRTILDIGCGLGGFAEVLRNMPGTKSVHGIDISFTAIEKAKKTYPQCTFSVCNIIDQPLPLSSERYDLILLQEVIWYILPYLGKVFDSIYNSLSDTGTFFIEQSFPKNQKYGKEYVDSCESLINKYILPKSFKINYHYIEVLDGFSGHLLFLKKS